MDEQLGPRPSIYDGPLNDECVHHVAGLWWEFNPRGPEHEDRLKGAFCPDCKARVLYAASRLELSPLARAVVAIDIIAGSVAAAVYLLEVAAKKMQVKLDTGLMEMIDEDTSVDEVDALSA